MTEDADDVHGPSGVKTDPSPKLQVECLVCSDKARKVSQPGSTPGSVRATAAGQARSRRCWPSRRCFPERNSPSGERKLQ